VERAAGAALLGLEGLTHFASDERVRGGIDTSHVVTPDVFRGPSAGFRHAK
jgi:hypothetical protein